MNGQSIAEEAFADIVIKMKRLPPDYLNAVKKEADELIQGNIERRKKELWGNVVAAIQKYEKECEDIELEDDEGIRFFYIHCNKLRRPGRLVLVEQ